uniref:Uncharacterized protein LOC102806613 n=1 Tax=Saccoglossus kowalevskii TaxID=10224 RepID=A0ABM0M085_SACKO|nr:PREDICTED: uncharacterized protein LOC102806613 [Saccoglossus kowalevskii]
MSDHPTHQSSGEGFTKLLQERTHLNGSEKDKPTQNVERNENMTTKLNEKETLPTIDHFLQHLNIPSLRESSDVYPFLNRCPKLAISRMLNRHLLPWRKPLEKISKDNLDDNVVMIEGHSIKCSSDVNKGWMHCFNIRPDDNSYDVPDIKNRFGCGIATFNNSLYVAGGSFYSPTTIRQIISNELFLYDFERRCWCPMAKMVENRCFFSLVASKNRLYAIGGINSTVNEQGNLHFHISSTIEMYDPKHNVWHVVGNLLNKLCCHGAEAINDVIYIMGGMHEFRCNQSEGSRSAYSTIGTACKRSSVNMCFDTVMCTFSQKRTLLVSRSNHGTCKTPKFGIFIIGGENSDGCMLDTIDLYSPGTDSWSRLGSTIPHGIIWPSCTFMEDTIYILGVDSVAMSDKSNTLIKYNMKANNWELMQKTDKMPYPRICTLKLQKNLTPEQGTIDLSRIRLFGPLQNIDQGPHFYKLPVENDAESLNDEKSQSEVISQDMDKVAANFQREESNKLIKQVYKLSEIMTKSDKVVLVVEDKKFSCSKTLLSSCSDYFKVMFTGGLKESTTKQMEIQIFSISKDAFCAIMQYISSGCLSLDGDNFIGVLHAGSHFQIAAVMELCLQFLREGTCPQNFVESFNIAALYNLHDEFIGRHEVVNLLDVFIDVANSYQSTLSDLSLENMMYLLKQPRIQCHKPLKVFNIIQAWIKENKGIRINDASKLLQTVKFSSMQVEELVDCVVEDCFKMDDPVSQDRIIHAQLNHFFPQRHAETNALDEDDEEEVLISMEGLAINRQAHLHRLDKRIGRWRKLSRMPVNQLSYRVAVVNNVLYIAGGEIHEALDDDRSGTTFATDEVYRYDPRHGGWAKVAPMNHRRTDFCFVSLDGKLYAVCGRNCNDKYGMNIVEVYDLQTNSWTLVKPLPVKLYAHAGTAYKGKLYITGGHPGSPYYISKKLYTYCTEIDEWEMKESMNIERTWHSMLTVGDTIYAIGGLSHDRINCLWKMEMYDPCNNTWVLADTQGAIQIPGRSLGTTIAGYKAVFKDGQIYALHGHFYEYDFIVSRSVLCYDPSKKTCVESPLLQFEGCQALCLLKVPKYLLSEDESVVIKGESSSKQTGGDFGIMNPEYGSSILQGLYDLFNESFLCDVQLKTTGKCYFVHGMVLAASSPVCRRLLMEGQSSVFVHSEDMSINLQRIDGEYTIIEIYGVSAADIELVLHVLYTLSITDFDKLPKLLQLAEVLQFESIIKICKACVIADKTANSTK